MERRLAAILAADVVRYSYLMDSDETATLQALKECCTTQMTLNQLSPAWINMLMLIACQDSIVADAIRHVLDKLICYY